MHIVDFAKPFNLFVDASLHTVSAVLTQTGDDGTELPVAFSRTKLSQAQTVWSTLEREAYAVLVALTKNIGVGYLASKLGCIPATILSST